MEKHTPNLNKDEKYAIKIEVNSVFPCMNFQVSFILRKGDYHEQKCPCKLTKNNPGNNI